MRIIHPKSFKAGCPWGAIDIANMNGITTRLHWSDQPYYWHVSEGDEVFIVVDGMVDMHFKENDKTVVATLSPADIFHASVGT